MNIWIINANIEKILELYWEGYSFYEALEIVKGGEKVFRTARTWKAESPWKKKARKGT